MTEPILSPETDRSQGSIGRTERVMLATLLLLQLVLRVMGALHHGINSDEPQHLHVAWAWTQGLLPYRDLFDNHSPLFSMLMSPLLALAGERPDIVVVMRFAMFPLVVIALVATWHLARRLFSARVAWWSVAIAGVNSEFLLASLEYRTDQLWMAVWLTALALLACGPLSPVAAFGFGVLVGTAFATSMKTTLLAASLALATVLMLLLRAGTLRRFAPRSIALRLVLVGLGATLVPLLLACWFAAHHAWPALVYNVFQYNLYPQLGLWHKATWRPVGMLLLLPVLAAVAVRLDRRARDPGLGSRRALIFLATGTAYGGFELVWPLVVRADLLPLLPVMVVFLAAGLLEAAEAVRRRGRLALAGILASALPALAIIETAFGPAAVSAARDQTEDHARFVRQVLMLTRRDELVMDLKGEAVFRRRPYYLGIETIAEEKIRAGLVPDDVPEHLIATRTAAVGQYLGWAYPPRTKAFLLSNYLPMGWLSVAGQVLDPPARESTAQRGFAVRVPQRYELTTSTGRASGWLDGTPWTGPREIGPGHHVYRPQAGEGRVVLIWASALDRGASPFNPRSLDP